jgi:branched-chain amino acid transport system ATP-binding protein
MLSVSGLSARYGRAEVLAGVSLGVGAGEVLVLLGRNGAGKSTTLKAIMGLVRPTAGRVALEGRDITGASPFEAARLGLGYVPEDRRVFAGLTVAENLEVGRKPPPQPGGGEAWTPERVYTLFPSLAAMRDRPGRQMSGGEQQMLAIGRTLMGNPRLLLLDEPSEGLAPVVVERMAVAVGELKAGGLSVLLSEQNLRFARAVGDSAAIIEGGRIRWRGALDSLLKDEETQARHLAV